MDNATENAQYIDMSNAKNKIKAGQTLTARSACDHDCIFSVEVMERKGNFAIVRNGKGETRRKIYTDNEGNEHLYAMGRYSMAPIFRAPALPVNVIAGNFN